MRRVCVIGLCGMSFLLKMNRLPHPGETVQSKALHTEPGGKGANQAVALARLGANVEFITALGADPHGEECSSFLAREGVTVDRVVRKDEATTIGVVAVEDGGENMVIVHPGASGHLEPGDIEAAAISAADCLLLQLEVPLATNIQAAKTARRLGKPVVLNAAPVVSDVAELLPSVDYLIANELEARQLAELYSEGESFRDFSFGAYQPAWLEWTAAQITAAGPQMVVITLGRRGAYYYTEKGGALIPSPQVTAVDTTGAGDMFTAAFTYSILKDNDLRAACRYAVAASALTVTIAGVMDSFPSAGEIDQFRSNCGL